MPPRLSLRCEVHSKIVHRWVARSITAKRPGAIQRSRQPQGGEPQGWGEQNPAFAMFNVQRLLTRQTRCAVEPSFVKLFLDRRTRRSVLGIAPASNRRLLPAGAPDDLLSEALLGLGSACVGRNVIAPYSWKDAAVYHAIQKNSLPCYRRSGLERRCACPPMRRNNIAPYAVASSLGMAIYCKPFETPCGKISTRLGGVLGGN